MVFDIKGKAGEIDDILENWPKKLSPFPNNKEGLNILALGKFSNNLLSPIALLLEYLLSENSETPKAETWTSVSILFFEHNSPKTEGRSEWIRSKSPVLFS